MRAQHLAWLLVFAFVLSACDARGAGGETRDEAASGMAGASTGAEGGHMRVPGNPQRRDAIVADEEELLATFALNLADPDTASARLVLTTHGSSSCPWSD
jgi:hypothetical protein